MRAYRCRLIFAVLTLMIAPLIGAAGLAAAEYRSVSVNSGAKSELWFMWRMTQDCQLIRGFSFDVLAEPKHGKVILEKDVDVVGPQWGTRDASQERRQLLLRCQGREVPVLVLYYQSNAGYQGFDEMAVRMTAPNRAAYTDRTFKISVR